ncbi:MAG: hypothetical protein PVH29_06515 [Candidatus Zixiibacteriota bacterium]|jgi:hypothetical protein
MKKLIITTAVMLGAASLGHAAEAAIVSFDEGELTISLGGSGTVSVVAQVDFKYVSNKTGSESLARATSQPLTVDLSGEETPVKITFVPPDGALLEVEIVVFIGGDEKARETLYY